MSPDVGDLVDVFFGDGNDLDPSALATKSPDLAAWLNERIGDLHAEPTAAHLLPRRSAGRITWYALAHSSRQARALAQELQAFVGDSFAQVERRQPLDPADMIEAAVLDFTDGHGFSFEVVPARQADVRASLDILADLRRSRPLRTDSGSKPLGRLLRDFEMSVVAGDEQISEVALSAVEQAGLLSTQNILFLRVRRLAALGRFQDIVALPEFGALVSITRPALVTADLLRAVYSIELETFETASDPMGALSHFETVVLPRYPALFKSRQGVVTPEAAKMFALHLVASGPFPARSLDELRSLPDLDSRDREWIASLGGLGTIAEAARNPRDAAVEYIRQGRFEESLRVAMSLPASLEQAELVLRSAIEIDSLEALRLAYGAVSSLPAAEQHEIHESRWLGTAWEHVRSIATAQQPNTEPAEVQLPGNWPEMFEQLGSRTGQVSLELAERSVVEWSIEQFTEEDATRVGAAIADASPEARHAVSDALPFLLQFVDRASDQRRFHQLLDDIVLVLLSEDTLRATDLHVLVGVLATLFDLGLDSGRYTTVVQDFLALWERTDAPSHLDAGLEFLDLLVAAPAPDPDARLLVLQAMLQSVQRWRRRVRIDQWHLLDDLADELGVPNATAALRQDEGEPDATAIGLAEALDGKTVAIYSLTESAAQRAQEHLARHFRNVRVELAHDHVASDRLLSLARTADLFVVATRSAKHAATNYIQANRPTSLPIIFPAGKGSASIIRSVHGWIAATSAS